jgi:hypothetical protein
MRWSEYSSETRGAVVFAAIIWSIVAFAAVSMALGNPTAINGVLGGSIPGLFVTVWAVIFARDDRRRSR